MKDFCPILWLHDWHFRQNFLQTIISIMLYCRPLKPLKGCLMHCNMKRCCYISQVSDHPTMPSNLAQESTQCLSICRRWHLQYGFYFIWLDDNSISTNNMTQSLQEVTLSTLYRLTQWVKSSISESFSR